MTHLSVIYLLFKVQCESNPTGVNGVVVYDDVTYPILSVSNRFIFWPSLTCP